MTSKIDLKFIQKIIDYMFINRDIFLDSDLQLTLSNLIILKNQNSKDYYSKLLELIEHFSQSKLAEQTLYIAIYHHAHDLYEDYQKLLIFK